MQFVAPWYADAQLLQLAAWLQEKHPWPQLQDQQKL
jgi:Asp-tRNA(Asn)/Glu-tRNA(Gln) amidotransferase A subunit family amidase